MNRFDEFVKTLTFEQKVKILQCYDNFHFEPSQEPSQECKAIIQNCFKVLTNGQNMTSTGFIFYFRELHHSICSEFAWKYVNFDFSFLTTTNE